MKSEKGDYEVSQNVYTFEEITYVLVLINIVIVLSYLL